MVGFCWPKSFSLSARRNAAQCFAARSVIGCCAFVSSLIDCLNVWCLFDVKLYFFMILEA